LSSGAVAGVKDGSRFKCLAFSGYKAREDERADGRGGRKITKNGRRGKTEEKLGRVNREKRPGTRKEK